MSILNTAETDHQREIMLGIMIVFCSVRKKTLREKGLPNALEEIHRKKQSFKSPISLFCLIYISRPLLASIDFEDKGKNRKTHLCPGEEEI